MPTLLNPSRSACSLISCVSPFTDYTGYHTHLCNPWSRLHLLNRDADDRRVARSATVRDPATRFGIAHQLVLGTVRFGFEVGAKHLLRRDHVRTDGHEIDGDRRHLAGLVVNDLEPLAILFTEDV